MEEQAIASLYRAGDGWVVVRQCESWSAQYTRKYRQLSAPLCPKPGTSFSLNRCTKGYSSSGFRHQGLPDYYQQPTVAFAAPTTTLVASCVSSVACPSSSPSFSPSSAISHRPRLCCLGASALPISFSSLRLLASLALAASFQSLLFLSYLYLLPILHPLIPPTRSCLSPCRLDTAS